MGLFRDKLKIKVCSGCGRAKVIGDFYRNRFNEDGLDHYCKTCRQAYFSEWSSRRRDRRYLINWRYRNRHLRLTV